MSALRALRDYGASLLALVLVWWIATDLMGTPPYLLPSPGATMGAFVDIAASGDLARHVAYTLRNLALGLAAGLLLGIAVAYAFAKLPRMAAIVEGPLVVLQTAPKIALAPLFLVWFGLGATAKVVLVFSLVFFPVLVGAYTGFKSLDSRLGDLARLCRLTALQRFLHVELPAALPDVFAGLKVGVVQALVGAILGEWMAGQDGVGYLMTFAAATYKTPLLFASVAVTVALGVTMHVIVGLSEARLLAWKDRAGG